MKTKEINALDDTRIVGTNFPISKVDPWLTVMPRKIEIYLDKPLPDVEYVRFLVAPTKKTMMKLGKRGEKF